MMSRRIVSRCTTVYRSATDKTVQGITEDGLASPGQRDRLAKHARCFESENLLTYSRDGITKLSVNQNQSGNQVNYSLY